MTENENLIKNEQQAIEAIKSNMPTSGYYMLRQSLEMAIKALEKQTPKKIVRKIMKKDLRIGRITFKAGTTTYWCPECEKAVSGSCKYCPNCGQKLYRRNESGNTKNG